MKAKHAVDTSCESIERTVKSLETAKMNAEKQDNKSKIECAIGHLNDACRELQKYQD